MTSPADTQPTPPAPPPVISTDPLLDTLPGAVIAQQESSTVLRVGVVTAIIEGSQITIRISGSDVLVDCSYLFAQYFPLLGDRVIVLRQDSQWTCLGQMSGVLESNNPLYNPSFELSGVATTPVGWTLVVGAIAAGTPTFLVAASGNTPVTGFQVVNFGTVSVGAGTSTAEAFSTPVGAVPDSKWTGAYFLTRALIGSSYPNYSTLNMRVQFLDNGGAVLADHLINNLDVGADVIGAQYRRLALTSFPAGFVAAPPGTASVRAVFAATFRLAAASSASFFIDNVILRQVN